MAEQLQNDQSANAEASINNEADDDFELVSDASLVDAARAFSIVSTEYESRRENEEDTTTERQENVHVIDPLEAFDMIQSEHRLLKDELAAQNQLLRQRMADMEDEESRRADEVTTLKKNIDELTLKLKNAKAQQTDLEREVEYFKESSEKADLLTAKLLEAEDVMNSQRSQIQQLQNDAGVCAARPAPVVSTDNMLQEEVAKKEERIKKMEASLASLEGALGSMHKERVKAQETAERLSSVNSELEEVITALQAQSEMDKAEWVAVRFDLEQQIQMLSGRVAAYERRFTNASSNGQLPQTGLPVLNHRDTQQHRATTTATLGEWVQCPRCHLPMHDVGPHPCPSIIDGID